MQFIERKSRWRYWLLLITYKFKAQFCSSLFYWQHEHGDTAQFNPNQMFDFVKLRDISENSFGPSVMYQLRSSRFFRNAYTFTSHLHHIIHLIYLIYLIYLTSYLQWLYIFVLPYTRKVFIGIQFRNFCAFPNEPI